jgi:hypothetical protein
VKNRSSQRKCEMFESPASYYFVTAASLNMTV